ncbi:glycoside hydrolase family 18 protein [Amanita muscaria Koide BX008]|uniref:chitinase n=1 Tax=Amanita muscaria (strain Koide BX008) TaxID=946122 RepID=A0A0C2TKK4_AMAMK|nr:glycoside hydrolase family 18 protein [Amanita muscaria Koide BX008]
MVMLKRLSSLATGTLIVATSLVQISAYDNSRSDNLAVYWGQNSYGATHTSDTANWQKSLSTYCQDNVINAIPLAFLDVFFSTGGDPEINFSNICSSSTNGVFSGTNLANCQFMAADIQACQAKGKIITISLGGASGAATFSSDAQGQAFAQTIWNLFLGGSSSTRPFGSAVLDGVDLDIEGGGSTGFAAFVDQLRTLMATGNKPYYVTAAPQCPFPDAYIGAALNAASFDAVYVQFYNNYCGNNAPSSLTLVRAGISQPGIYLNRLKIIIYNFIVRDNWARTQSPNPNVKVYIGAPASTTAAGSGYVDATTLGNLAISARAQYPSFGGIMLWDASQAYANGRYDVAVKNAMGSGTGSTTTPSTTTTTKTSTTPTTTSTTPTTTSTTPTTTTTSTATPTSCAGVAAWSSTVAYNGGSWVTYK